MTRNDVLDQLSDCMDFSNYPKSHPRFSLKHKSIPGYFKDENSSNYMVEVIGLKSKCYITKVKQRRGITKEQVVCKGITKPARSKLSMATFRNVIKDYKNIKVDIDNLDLAGFVIPLHKTCSFVLPPLCFTFVM